MREFTLKNNIGEVYRLNSLDNFLHEPEGIGFTRNTTYKKIGTNYEVIQDGFEQTPVKGQIMFKTDLVNSAYIKYLKFSRFLQEIPLTLIYRIPGGEFYIDALPGAVEKTEINGALGMDVGITLMPTSMWYRKVKETGTGSVTVKSDSKNESPVCLKITGKSVSNSALSWSQTVDGVSKMTGSLTGVTIASSDTVYIRTDVNPYQIYKVSSGGTRTDLYAKSNFTTSRFPFFYKGVNQFSVSGASITVEGRILYETV